MATCLPRRAAWQWHRRPVPSVSGEKWRFHAVCSGLFTHSPEIALFLSLAGVAGAAKNAGKKRLALCVREKMRWLRAALDTATPFRSFQSNGVDDHVAWVIGSFFLVASGDHAHACEGGTPFAKMLSEGLGQPAGGVRPPARAEPALVLGRCAGSDGPLTVRSLDLHGPQGQECAQSEQGRKPQCPDAPL